MLLVLSEQHRGHLSFLTAVDTQVVAEFGRIALDFLRRGTSPKIYEAAARKLGASVEQVKHAVEGLMFLVLESCKLTLSEADFLDSLLVLGFSKEVNDMLLQLYQQQGPQVRSVLSQMIPTLPEYHSLEWRLDVHVSRRALRQQLCPVMTLCLALTEGGTGEQSTRRLLQARPSTLLHLLRELESALDAMKSTHTRHQRWRSAMDNMSRDSVPCPSLRRLCLRAVREHFSALGTRAADVLPLDLLEELQPHLTVWQLDRLQPLLNRRGVSTLSAWRNILRHMRGPSCVLDVSAEDEAKLLVMRGLFPSILYDFNSSSITKQLCGPDHSALLCVAARYICHFVLLNMEPPLRRLTQENRRVLQLLEEHAVSVGVSHSLDPRKAENQMALLVLHRLLDHGHVGRVVLEARCPHTLAWILDRRGPQPLHPSAQVEGLRDCRSERARGPACSNTAPERGPSCSNTAHVSKRAGGPEQDVEDPGPISKRSRLDHRDTVDPRAGLLDRAVPKAVPKAAPKPAPDEVPEACRRGQIWSLELRQCQAACLTVLLCALPSWSCLRALTLHSDSVLSHASVLQLCQALQPGGGLTELSISTLPCPSLLEQLLEACPRLLALSAEVHSIMNGPATAHSHCEHPLQTLSVSMNQQPSQLLALAPLLQRCRGLSSLHLCGLRLRSGACYGQLLSTITERCGGLRSLSLEDMNLSQCLEPVLQLLSSCQLHELCMKDCRLLEKWTNKEESLQRLTSALAVHPTLHTLSLAHNRIARLVPVLAQLFSGPPLCALRRLDLSSNFIQPGELLELSERLRALRPAHRITLDLRRNPGDRDPRTWNSAVRGLAGCCHLLLEGWTSTDTLVDHVSMM